MPTTEREPDESYTVSLWEHDGYWEGELRVGGMLDVSTTSPDREAVLACIASELAES